MHQMIKSIKITEITMRRVLAVIVLLLDVLEALLSLKYNMNDSIAMRTKHHNIPNIVLM